MPDPNDPHATAARGLSASAPSAASDRDETAAGNPGSAGGAPGFGPPTVAGEVGTLGPYRIVKELGRGGMGAVYAALDTRLERQLALKVMLPQFATDTAAKERFLREARAAARVKHVNVVTVYEADERGGVPYIAMEFLEGLPLDAYLKTKGSPALPQIVRIAAETAEGLAAAHKFGLVHRDIKPANIWLEAPNGSVKVLDFGLARPVDAETELTNTGAVVGTPAYMSPEQARGERVDARTDLFSLGTVLYRLCAGRAPFGGPTTMAVLMALGMDEPAPVREVNPAVPESLAALTHRLLAKRPEHRPQTADEVVRQLRTIAQELAAPRADLSTSLPQVVRARAVYAATPVPVAPEANPFADLDARDNEPAATEVERAPTPGRANPGGRLLRPAIGGAFLLVVTVAVAAVVLKTGAKKVPEITTGEKGPTEPSAPAPPPLPATFANGLGMEFVKVPKGAAWLGGGGGKPGETKVVFESDFYLGKFEVTQEEWEKVMGTNPSAFSRTGEQKEAVRDVPDANLKRFPVETVSWNECQTFIEKLNAKTIETGWVYRLPVAAEWEYACRGGAVSRPDSAFDFYFARPTNALSPQQANFKADNEAPPKRPRPVGSYAPNALGLHDMHGNIHEWCGDLEKAIDGLPSRVNKGGNWSHESGACRAAFRLPGAPSDQSADLGLRIARVPAPRAPAESDRKTAEWVLSVGGWVKIRDGAGERDVKGVGGLPTGPFDVIWVVLNGCRDRVTDADLLRLRGLPRLTYLHLFETTVTDAGMAHVKEITGLRSLHLGVTRVTDAGLAQLKALTGLEQLYLDSVPVGDAGVEVVAGLPALEHLHLSGTGVTDAGLARLRGLSALTILDLHNTRMTDAGLEHLRACKRLVHLDVKKTGVRAEAIGAFAEALPACKIEHDGGVTGPKK